MLLMEAMQGDIIPLSSRRLTLTLGDFSSKPLALILRCGSAR